MAPLIENLTKARDSATFTAHDLRAALATAGAVESLVLLPLIARAATLAADIEQLLLAAIDHDIIDTALDKMKGPTA